MSNAKLQSAQNKGENLDDPGFGDNFLAIVKSWSMNLRTDKLDFNEIKFCCSMKDTFKVKEKHSQTGRKCSQNMLFANGLLSKIYENSQ